MIATQLKGEEFTNDWMLQPCFNLIKVISRTVFETSINLGWGAATSICQGIGEGVLTGMQTISRGILAVPQKNIKIEKYPFWTGMVGLTTLTTLTHMGLEREATRNYTKNILSAGNKATGRAGKWILRNKTPEPPALYHKILGTVAILLATGIPLYGIRRFFASRYAL